jgi:hypothetical protein
MEGNLIIQILGYFGSAAVIVVGLSRWLGGVWAARIIRNEQARINVELEAEKVRLAEQLEISKAALLEKTRLAEVRLNSVNQERFSALKENYELLAEVWLDCRWAIQPDELGREKPPEKERLEKAAISLDIYFKDFERKKMFLSDVSQEAVYDFIYRVWTSLDKLRIFANSADPLEQRLQELYGEWIHDLSPKMNEARKSIESEYKALIGVDEHNKALQRTCR